MKYPKQKQEIQQSLEHLIRSYAQAVEQLNCTLRVLQRELELHELEWSSLSFQLGQPVNHASSSERPVADRSTFCVRWKGKSCFLGNTLLFRFFEKISQFPGRYIKYTELLDEVWEGGKRTNSTVRQVVKRLRDRLSAAGMVSLAKAIDGHQTGHYILHLDRSRK